MCNVYTWFVAWSSKRERDVRRMNEKKVCLHVWVNAVFAVIIGDKVEVTVILLQ